MKSRLSALYLGSWLLSTILAKWSPKTHQAKAVVSEPFPIARLLPASQGELPGVRREQALLAQSVDVSVC